eukprot:94323-Pyramimonas_sp.AAC.1
MNPVCSRGERGCSRSTNGSPFAQGTAETRRRGLNDWMAWHRDLHGGSEPSPDAAAANHLALQ